jgi:hypothetical protein
LPGGIRRITVCTVLVGKHERMSPFGRPRHRWEDNDKMDLQQMHWKVVDWIDLAEDMEG